MIAERSDWQALLDNRRFTLSERVPEPLDMSYREIVEWLDEYSDGLTPISGSGPNRWSVLMDNVYINGKTIKETVSMAAAYHKEANE